MTVFHLLSRVKLVFYPIRVTRFPYKCELLQRERSAPGAKCHLYQCRHADMWNYRQNQNFQFWCAVQHSCNAPAELKVCKAEKFRIFNSDSIQLYMSTCHSFICRAHCVENVKSEALIPASIALPCSWCIDFCFFFVCHDLNTVGYAHENVVKQFFPITQCREGF